MPDKQNYYYKIYDDKEELNYLRCTLPHDKVEELLTEYEKTHQKYFNPEFISYIQEKGYEAEIIKVSDISY
ncbi:MAG: hypothetical protein COW08_02585 [Ignavibacteriales bacterium CG12_big_fil_rev_8_21_14_0_65_30_8]|nr:MAG: hypothetical protein COW08_02585 [Ignavibacteriales bacterium CG12_big_fil_rev_8_21_14_0_65_30_8]